MSEPLTGAERKDFLETIQQVLALFKDTDSNLSDDNLAMARVASRYEATLQAQEEKIKRLVTVLERFMREPRADYRQSDIDMENEAMAAIKEVMNG